MFYSLWLASLTSKCKEETLLTLLTYILAEIFLFKKKKKRKEKKQRSAVPLLPEVWLPKWGPQIVHHEHYVQVC